MTSDPPIIAHIDVTLLASDMTFVADVRLPRPKGAMPDIILYHHEGEGPTRAFGRERVRDPHGARRWHYCEISCAIIE
jgi:hypothetical protein